MLDLVILNEKSLPAETLSLGIDDHADLIEIACKHQANQLIRLAEYYEDITYSLDELCHNHFRGGG